MLAELALFHQSDPRNDGDHQKDKYYAYLWMRKSIFLKSLFIKLYFESLVKHLLIFSLKIFFRIRNFSKNLAPVVDTGNW